VIAGATLRGHVFLVGLPGSGKTTVGRLAARRLGVRFVDLDEEVERSAGVPVGDLFAGRGEEAFRDLEAQALRAVASGPPAVVACGGGVVLREENRRALRASGTVVYLEAPVARLVASGVVGTPGRPLLRSENDLARLAAEREPLYRDVAHVVVDAQGSPPAVADRVLDAASPAGPAGGAPAGEARVETAAGAYAVWVGRGLLPRAAELLPPGVRAEKAFVVADREVADRFLEPMAGSLGAAGARVVHLSIPPGEAAKTLSVAEALYRQLALQEAHRDDLVVALGGGAAGDVAGFVAATYMRGLPVLQVPTTLTGQVDAAIGGKTAVNLPEGKNLVGAFHQPVAVVADVETLASLPEAAFRSGLGEVAKVALTLDLELLSLLERDAGPVVQRRPDALEEVVLRCARAKAGVVSRDERDASERLVLNYGHTLGHALERLDGFAGRSHGEAVAVGMAFAARLAESRGLAAPGLAARHARLLASLGLPGAEPVPDPAAAVAAMRLDKKHRAGIRFVLLEDVGRPVVVEDVAEEEITLALEAMGR
jgi:shikimate kinase / 3-dehydroquinate synthase